MRFIKWFLSFLIFLVVVGGGSFLITREALLIWAQNRISRDVTFLLRTNTWSNVTDQCLSEVGSPVNRLQLRFLNDREYVLEVACEGSFQYYPWSETKTLPWQVRKTTGNAGFSIPLDHRAIQGEITLNLWLRNIILTAEDENLAVRSGESTILSENIVSSCQAHGLTCCDAITEQGVGDVFSRGVNDCQETCYRSCQSRPNLLFFQTDPAADSATRQVKLDAENTFMLFNYTFATPQADVQEVVLDFGDGTQETFSTAIGKTTHEYSCQQDACHYVASIKATDQQGVSSADLRISQIEIVVQSGISQ